MNPKQITLIGLVFLLFFCATQINEIFARTTTQYQLYRLSNDPSDDRRPKLAVNDQGIVWVVWESNRDGDFDLYGRRFENEQWTDLIEVAQDSNETFISDVIFYKKTRLFVFGTEADSISWVNIFGFLFYKEFMDNSFSKKKYVTYIQHTIPYQFQTDLIYNMIPQISLLSDSMIICYHRDNFSYGRQTSCDSLFLRYFTDETWSQEFCDSVFFERAGFKLTDIHRFPTQRINLVSQSFFFIKKDYWNGYTPDYQEYVDIGLFINQHLEKKYVILNKISGYNHSVGDPDHLYGSNKNSIFRGNSTYIQQLNLNIPEELKIQKQWEISNTSNIKISQMSDLVAFVWSDSANIYVKTLQDFTWYETLEIPLNGLTHIDNSLNCAVYNNQQIWITFDAISDDNKDVYALSVPACFVVDTVLTSVKQIIQNNTLPNDFALFQNYPNPFNSSTTIKYSLAEKCDVSLEIYDINGRLVDEIISNNQERGEQEFRWTPQSLTSGVYLVKIQIQNWQKTIKAILLK